MFAVYGISFLSAAVLLCAVTLPAYRRPDPPVWARWSMFSETVAGVAITTIVIGLMFVLKFFINFRDQQFGLYEATLVLGVAAVTAVLVGALLLHQRVSR